jgi:hypothetical protein
MCKCSFCLRALHLQTSSGLEVKNIQVGELPPEAAGSTPE